MINKTLTVLGSSYLVLFREYDAVCARTTDLCWSVRGFGPRSNSHVMPVDEQNKPKLVSNNDFELNKTSFNVNVTNKQTNKTHRKIKQQLYTLWSFSLTLAMEYTLVFDGTTSSSSSLPSVSS